MRCEPQSGLQPPLSQTKAHGRQPLAPSRRPLPSPLNHICEPLARPPAGWAPGMKRTPRARPSAHTTHHIPDPHRHPPPKGAVIPLPGGCSQDPSRPEAPSPALPGLPTWPSCARSQGAIHPRGPLIETMCARRPRWRLLRKRGLAGLWVPGGRGEGDQLTPSLPSWGDLCPRHMRTRRAPGLRS